MISHVYGDIARSGEGFVVIDVGGIGYQVNVTKPILNELTGKKEKVKLYTYLHVREDAHILYGFLNQSDLEMFKLLISVTRVGPQIAMNILSQIKIEELAAAIIHEDEKVLTRISGVGAKNAKRLILELKDKMTKKMEGFVLPATSNVNYDAVSALVSLGFPRQSAERAVEAVSGGEQKVEAIIKAALLKLKE
ncbi:Holliday junction ATP-dependent DNA helicase RuvA [Methanosarcinales archaeon]|nr:Holliday junction branch migration protein RuvA [Candidatus Methanoperedens sp.]CAG0949107.1 Holliday junction ATP-dependent DNA helicase RuvA [Methanosarcinales archaeon]